ncbi:MAG: HNH endonuclease signature motif containing protein [Anaerolineae bacterium]
MLRRYVFERANGCCEYCLSQALFSTESFALEHIHPRALGGTTTLDNLALSCSGCNGHKGRKTHGVRPAIRPEHCPVSPPPSGVERPFHVE